MSKKVYAVRGSEDGALGIYSNFKAAYERACQYIKASDEEKEIKIDQTYKQALHEVKKLEYGRVDITSKDTWFDGAEIECWPLLSKSIYY